MANRVVGGGETNFAHVRVSASLERTSVVGIKTATNLLSCCGVVLGLGALRA